MTWRGLAKKKLLGYIFLVYVLFAMFDSWTTVPTVQQLLTSNVPSTSLTVCPPPYTVSVGDVPGPGTLDSKTHSIDNITQ